MQCRLSADVDGGDCCASFQCIEVIRPVLHHLPALGQELGVHVRSGYLIAFRMGKLPVDHVPAVPKLAQHGSGQPAESVACHSRFVAHAIERLEHRVVRDVASALDAIEHMPVGAV